MMGINFRLVITSLSSLILLGSMTTFSKNTGSVTSVLSTKATDKPYEGSKAGYQHPGLSRVYGHADEHLSSMALFSSVEYTSLMSPESELNQKGAQAPWNHYILKALCPPSISADECKKIIQVVYANDQREVAKVKLYIQNEKAKLATSATETNAGGNYIRFDPEGESKLKPQVTYVPSWNDVKGIASLADQAQYDAWVKHLKNSAHIDKKSFLLMTDSRPIDPNNPTSAKIKFPVLDENDCPAGKSCKCEIEKKGEVEEKYCYDDGLYTAALNKKKRNELGTNTILENITSSLTQASNQLNSSSHGGLLNTLQKSVSDQEVDFKTARNMFAITLNEGIEKSGFRAPVKADNIEDKKEDPTLQLQRELAQQDDSDADEAREADITNTAIPQGTENASALENQNHGKTTRARQVYDEAKRIAKNGDEVLVHDLTKAMQGSSQTVHYSDENIAKEIIAIESEYESQ